MNFIDKWMFKLTGPKVPVFKVMDVDKEGAIKSLILAKWIRRSNSVIDKWNVEGSVIDPEHKGIIRYTDESGLTQQAYIEHKGTTCDLYVEPNPFPNYEKVIGAGAMVDDIAESLDLGKSMKNLMIGLIIGILLGWWVVGPMMSGIMS